MLEQQRTVRQLRSSHEPCQWACTGREGLPRVELPPPLSLQPRQPRRHTLAAQLALLMHAEMRQRVFALRGAEDLALQLLQACHIDTPHSPIA